VVQAGSSPAVNRKINCGGTATGSWEADGSWTMSSDGGADSFANAIANAGEVPQVVYQTRRYGKTVTYNLAIPDGTYNVRLHFAELYWTAAGKKRFNVTIEGRTVLTNLDLFAAAGGKNIALTRTFENVAVSGGLQIQGVASVGAAQFHGIEVWSTGPGARRALSAKASATWPMAEARSGDAPWAAAPELVDGDTNTLWIGNAGAPSWAIALDFGESIPLQNLDILYAGLPWTNIGVMGTGDLLEWFDLGLLTNGSIPCRALYLHFPNDGSGSAPAIREIRFL
jgi:hypothetical protein